MSTSPPVENTKTRVPNEDDIDERHLSQFHRDASAIADDNLEDKIPDQLQQLEYEWEDDLGNPRNWSAAKKWTATTIVSFAIRIVYLFTRPNFGFLSACALHFCNSVSKFYYGT